MLTTKVAVVILSLVLVRGMEGQVAATSRLISPESVGLPQEPPFLTLLGMASTGTFVTDSSIPPKGPVAEVLTEELRGEAMPSGPVGSVMSSGRVKFDAKGHITESVGNNDSDTIYRYQDGRLVNMETTVSDSKRVIPKTWNTWSYDASGKLVEYRRGRGAELQNHELHFNRDAKGRVLSFEYRQGADDQPSKVTEISYSANGKTIELTKRYAGSKIADHSTRFLDDQGRVARVALSSEGRAPSKEAMNIHFRYDQKGRLIEQTTDAVGFSESGVEEDLPPGTISIVYDDDKHTKTTTYSVAGEGTMRIVLTLDGDGATVGYFMDSGAERILSKFACEFDGHGNWTNCIQSVEMGEQKFVKARYRRTITYR